MSPEVLREWVDELASFYATELPGVWSIVPVIIAGAGLLFILSKALEFWLRIRAPFQEAHALFFSAAQRQRATERCRFAKHLALRLELLNEREAWDDNRFAELEAEVEAPAPESPLAEILRFGTPRVRRQRLSRALERSRAPLILLQGEPGSGKSVALRHVALSMARAATRSRSDRCILPIYINLKLLQPKPGQAVDRNLIEDFVSSQLRGSNRDIDAYLDAEFVTGMKDGRWLFLFDSFDELPDILASTDADAHVRAYASAIYEFLHGMNRCRGVIAYSAGLGQSFRSRSGHPVRRTCPEIGAKRRLGWLS